MTINIKECKGADIVGVCSDGFVFNGRRSLIRFGFVWNKDSKEFSSISDGHLDDEYGVICRFARRNGIEERTILEPVKSEFEKTLSEMLSLLKVRLIDKVCEEEI